MARRVRAAVRSTAGGGATPTVVIDGLSVNEDGTVTDCTLHGPMKVDRNCNCALQFYAAGGDVNLLWNSVKESKVSKYLYIPLTANLSKPILFLPVHEDWLIVAVDPVTHTPEMELGFFLSGVGRWAIRRMVLAWMTGFLCTCPAHLPSMDTSLNSSISSTRRIEYHWSVYKTGMCPICRSIRPDPDET